MIRRHSFCSKFIQLILLISVIGCKSVAVLPTKEPVEKVNLKLLTKEIEKAETKIKVIRSRIKAEYSDSNQKQQVSLNLRMISNEAIWMGASILIPIAKVLITPDSVGFYEKFQKTYYEGDMSLINDKLGVTFKFEDLQNILLGNPITDLKGAKVDIISHPKYYVLIPKIKNNQFQPTYFFDPTTFRLKEQRFIINSTGHSLSIRYPKLQNVEDKTLPRTIEISVFDGSNLVQITLDFIRTDFPKNLSVPFAIPKGYKRINL